MNLGLLKQVFRGNKTKVRSQLCLVGTEDGRLVPKEYDVLRVCCLDMPTETAHILDSSNQVYSVKDKKWYQLIGERSVIPICVFRPTNIKDIRKLINALYLEAKEAVKAKKYREAKENAIWKRFTYMTAALVIAGICVFLIKSRS